MFAKAAAGFIFNIHQGKGLERICQGKALPRGTALKVIGSLSIMIQAHKLKVPVPMTKVVMAAGFLLVQK